jgi:hypothetical protein
MVVIILAAAVTAEPVSLRSGAQELFRLLQVVVLQAILQLAAMLLLVRL